LAAVVAFHFHGGLFYFILSTYTYDNNGNLTKDSNKGIASITYNSLNLPSVVTFSNGNTVTYTYSADGRKLRTVHVAGGTTTTTDYAGNVVYENGTQKRMLTETGYVDLTDNAHYFYIKDHLGNTRVVADEDGSAKEQNEYYPFGLNYTATTYQPYKYNGKELDTRGGLNWYDYGARHYDAALGRFLTVDPLAEKMYGWSPYGYCFNSPIKFVDLNGEIGQVAIGAVIGGIIGGGYAIWQGKSFSEVAAATVGGAIDGAITATGIGLVGKVVTGAIGACAGNIVEQGINVISGNQSDINNIELATSAMLGGLSGYLSHQIDKVTLSITKSIDEKYAMPAVQEAITKEVKSEITETGQKIGSSTKKTINHMTNQRIDVLSNSDKAFVKGIANTTEWGMGVVYSGVNTEVIKWIDEKEK
jgi:RHS repeat-associated protein